VEVKMTKDKPLEKFSLGDCSVCTKETNPDCVCPSCIQPALHMPRPIPKPDAKAVPEHKKKQK
jgi:hypothetical protein